MLHSEHPILIERAVAAIRDAVVPPAARGFNYDVVEGKPTGARIVALAQTLPMMAQRRHGATSAISRRWPPTTPSRCSRTSHKPNPSTVVVASRSKLDKRLKLFATLSQEGLRARARGAAPARAVGARRGQARGREHRRPRRSRRLVETVGDDLSRLALSVEQLGLYAGNRAVTSDDVDELIADTRERSVFELTDAIGAGGSRAGAARRWSRCAISSESAVGVVVMLARHVRNLSQLSRAARAGACRATSGARGSACRRSSSTSSTQQARSYTPDALARATARSRRRTARSRATSR